MLKPFKKLFSFGRKRSKHEEDQADKEFYKELKVIWSDGTWNIPWHGQSGRVMDGAARGILLDCFRFEEDEAFIKSTGRPPWNAYPSPIPSGWKPSEAAFKRMAAKLNLDTKAVHYMVAELTHLKRILP
jgi:hypothetical protein